MKCILLITCLWNGLPSPGWAEGTTPTEVASRARTIATTPFRSDLAPRERIKLFREFDALCSQLGAAEVRDILNSSPEATGIAAPVGLIRLGALYVRLGETDPDHALAFRPARPRFECGNGPSSSDFILSGIARKDGPKAFREWKTLPASADPFTRTTSNPQPVEWLLKGWAAGDPQGARAALDKPEFAGTFEAALEGYFAGLPAKSDWKAEAAWLETLKPESVPPAAGTALLRRWLWEDPEAALAWWRTRPNKAEEQRLEGILAEWIDEEPDRALTWLQGWKESPEDRRSLITGAVLATSGPIPLSLAEDLPMIHDPEIRRLILARHADGLADPFGSGEGKAARLRELLGIPTLTPQERAELGGRLRKLE